MILNGDKLLCRTTECNLGNFIGDAFVYGRVVENYGSLYWTDAAIAVVNSGGKEPTSSFTGNLHIQLQQYAHQLIPAKTGL